MRRGVFVGSKDLNYEKEREEKVLGKIVKKVLPFLGAVLFMADIYISLCVFPANLILDLFCDKVSQADLDRLEYDYGQMAGYPAGEGIPVVHTKEEYAALGWYKKIEGSDELGGKEYITFETDSLIPLDFYRLRGGVELTVHSSRRQGAVIRYRKSFETSPYLTDRSYYNRCYLVALPDGNYVLAWLEDAYYWKYRMTGRVQLPLGCKESMTANEKEAMAPYIQEYGLDERAILMMVSEERDEQNKNLYFLVQLGVLVVSSVLMLVLAVAVEKIVDKVASARKTKVIHNY